MGPPRADWRAASCRCGERVRGQKRSVAVRGVGVGRLLLDRTAGRAASCVVRRASVLRRVTFRRVPFVLAKGRWRCVAASPGGRLGLGLAWLQPQPVQVQVKARAWAWAGLQGSGWATPREAGDVMDMTNIAERLERRLGTGSDAIRRRALYQRCQDLVDEHGEPAYHVVAVVAADAQGKSDPGRYFAYVVMRRLSERGIISAPDL